MKLIADESNVQLASIFEELKDIAPEMSTYDERIFILPSNLGDLDNTEFLKEVRSKIEKLKATA